MANFNFNEYEATHRQSALQQVSSEFASKPFIENIKVKDGEETVVRFYVSKSDDIEISTIHSVELLSKKNTTYTKYVSCLRESNQDALDICPLCKNESPIKSRAFIKLLEYTNQDGEVIATPKLWDTSVTMARTLNSFLAEYGDLTEYIFKLKRTGTGTSTRYTIVPTPTTSPVYRPEIYKKEFEKFEDYVISPYWRKSFDDMQSYVDTGVFPKKIRDGVDSSERVDTATKVEPSKVETTTRPVATSIEEQSQPQRPRRFTY